MAGSSLHRLGVHASQWYLRHPGIHQRQRDRESMDHSRRVCYEGCFGAEGEFEQDCW